jgi:hypothetical protein
MNYSVYIILKSRDGCVKVGRVGDLRSRLCGLRIETSNPSLSNLFQLDLLPYVRPT